MKRFLIFCIACLTVLVLRADDYKIVNMNTSSVLIGNRVCKVGDVFSDKSVIYWSHDQQALKAVNIRTKEMQVFSKSDFKEESAKTVEDYYVKRNRLSSLALPDKNSIPQQMGKYFLYDTIYIDVPIMTGNSYNYYVSFLQNNSYVKKFVTKQNGKIVVDRSLFGVCNNREINISLLYNTDGSNSYYIVKDSIKIVVLPLKIDE